MKEFFETAKSAGFGFTLFASERNGLDMYVQHKTDKQAIRHFGGPDFDLVCEDALQYVRNYDAFINTAATCSK